MNGRRIYPDADGSIRFAEGDYGRTIYGEWLARPLGYHLGSLAGQLPSTMTARSR